MSEKAADTGSVTVVVAHRVRPEHEAEYLQWAASINNACRAFPGFAGIELVRPVPGVQNDYVVIYRFDSYQHLDDWLNSEVRRAFLAQGQSFFDGEERRHCHCQPADSQFPASWCRPESSLARKRNTAPG